MNSLVLEGQALEHLAAAFPARTVEGVCVLLESVWQSSNHAVALYFRGSVRREHRTKPPMDIDLYLVVSQQTPRDRSAVDLCLELHDRLPNLPRLDLSIFERANVLNSEIRQMTRLILLHDSTFIAGEDIRALLPATPLDRECAELLWAKQTEIVAKKVRGLSTPEFATASRSLQTYLCSSVVKSALRLVMPAFVLQGEFTRDPQRCAAYLATHRPDLTDAVQSVSQCGPYKSRVDIAAVREGAEHLLRELGWSEGGDLLLKLGAPKPAPHLTRYP